MNAADRSKGSDKWWYAMSRVAGASALLFGLLYVVGLIHLVSFAVGLGVPYQIVRQDPISVASAVIYIAIPAAFAVAMWMGFHEQYTAMRRFFERHKRLLEVVIVAGVALTVLTFLAQNYFYAAAGAVVALLFLVLRAPTRLADERRAAALAAILVVAGGLFGWAAGREVRLARSTSPLVTVLVDQRMPFATGVASDAGWVYAGLRFAFEDQAHLYLVEPGSPADTLVIPLDHVLSMKLTTSHD